MRQKVTQQAFLASLVFVLVAASGIVAGAAPHLAYIFPPGGQRGTTVKITLSGSELGTLNGFYTTGAGLTAKVEPGGDAGTRTAEIVIAKDAPLGIQQIRFYGSGGLTNARFFSVGQWPEQARQPSGAVPLKIVPPMTVNGRIANYSQRDGVTFQAKAGETLVCAIQGLRILGQVNDSWLKGYMEIRDAGGNVLADSDGTADDYYRWDPVIAFTPPKDGEYTVWFRDLNWRGAPMAVYRLTIAAMPHAFGIFPLGGRRGTTSTVHFFGPNLKDAARPLAIPADATDNLEVDYTAPNGTTNLRPFQASDLPDVLQKGGNNSRETAQSVPFPCAVNGRIEKDSLRDFYKFRVEKAQRIALEVYSRRLGTPMDPELLVYDANGKTIAADDDARQRDSRIEREFAPGEYTARIRDIDDRGGIAFPYRLLLTSYSGAFHLVATPDGPMAAGGASAVLSVHVERQDGFDGDVTITAAGLPPGITADPLTVPKGQQDGKLTLHVSAATAAGPFRLTVLGTGKSGDRTLHAIATTSETYNIQGTAYQRDLLGPIVLIGAK